MTNGQRKAGLNEVSDEQDSEQSASNAHEQSIEAEEVFCETSDLLPDESLEIEQEAFPELNDDVNESFQINEGTTMDKAEFITHQSDTQDYDPERDRLEQIAKSQKSDGYFRGPPEGAKTTPDSSDPGTQRQNNERNRVRAEEMSSDNFKFVSALNVYTAITLSNYV